MCGVLKTKVSREDQSQPRFERLQICDAHVRHHEGFLDCSNKPWLIVFGGALQGYLDMLDRNGPIQRLSSRTIWQVGLWHGQACMLTL